MPYYHGDGYYYFCKEICDVKDYFVFLIWRVIDYLGARQSSWSRKV